MEAAAPLPSDTGSGTIPDTMFRDAVRKRMEEKGMNLYQLAAASGVRYSRLHDWTNGNSDSIRSDSLEAVCAVLDLSVIGPPAPKPAARRQRGNK